MKNLIEEFKSFVLKGNVVTLAVGVIIGGAFGKIVDSMVKDIITPVIGKVGGAPDFSGIAIGATKVMNKEGKEVLEGGIMIGNFINAAIGFLILAAVVFFLIVKPYNAMMARFEKKVEPAPAGPPPATLDDVVAALKELKK
jgi:large conductance mechanosensitive channel